MTEPGMIDEAMKIGLLMEAAQAQQRLGQESLERLAQHTRDLDMIVRDEIRRTVAEALGSLASESRRATESLRRMRRAANLRTLLWTVSMRNRSAPRSRWAKPGGCCPRKASWRLCARDAMRLRPISARLEQRGGLARCRKCGARARLCVRVDRSAPAYGPGADYLVIKGY